MTSHLSIALLSLLAVSPSVEARGGILETIAGGGPRGSALLANVNDPSSVAIDKEGNLFIATQYQAAVFKVDSSGNLTFAAGDGTYGSAGDGGLATRAKLMVPCGLALDGDGNLFIADREDNRIRRVDATTGIITTVAGSGGYGLGGDGGPATDARLAFPFTVVLDKTGNLFIADTGNGRIRRVDAATGIISTVVVQAGSSITGDGSLAVTPGLSEPSGLALDNAGNLLIASSGDDRVFLVNVATGLITTVAGGGATVGDGGPATSALVDRPQGMVVDATGNLFIAETYGGRVRRVDAVTGIITTVAGDGTSGFSGDGGPATNAQLNQPADVALDSQGNLYFADQFNNRIRVVQATTAIISTVAGNGTTTFGGDGGPATSASLRGPASLSIDTAGHLFFADAENNRIRVVDDVTGIITTVAGNGSEGFSGDGGPAAAAALWFPTGVTTDRAGNLFIGDSLNHRIRRVEASTGIITTFAGIGTAALSGDHGPATSAEFYFPAGLTLDGAGNLFIADSRNHRIRRVDAVSRVITTVAGSGLAGPSSGGFGGDGGPATSARLYFPSDVTLDSGGHLFIADAGNNRIRRIDRITGVITTVAGNGDRGFSGDGGPALSASLTVPAGVAFDSAGNLLIADGQNDRIRVVDHATGIISTAAGNGKRAFSGEGCSARSGSLAIPGDVIVDLADQLIIADSGNHRIRRVTPGQPSQPPEAVAGADFHVECSSQEGAMVRLDARSSRDPDSAPGTNDDIVSFEWIEDSALPSRKRLGDGETLDVTLSLGIHTVTLQVTDCAGTMDADDVEITVADTQPPKITLAPNPAILWPPDRRLVDIMVAAVSVDACGPSTLVLTSIVSDEPDDAAEGGDGKTVGDIQGQSLGTADFNFSLRAERSSSGDGRSYSATYAAVDSRGNMSSATAVVIVPRNRSAAATPEP